MTTNNPAPSSDLSAADLESASGGVTVGALLIVGGMALVSAAAGVVSGAKLNNAVRGGPACPAR